jgi:GR25 family glycosyltransferase involved in LPS biosynthesis|uniref:Glycosyl transferase family 25 domain-containing protein n=1 Tax=viral metagenome TaxID=1070528 RepID=A0A6C0CW27_9ZZZZ
MNTKFIETIKRNQTRKIQHIYKILDNYKVHLTFYKRSEERKSILNEYSENIYVINLKKDIIRRNYINVLFKKLNIEYTLVVVEPISDELFSLLHGNEKQLSKSEVGCSLSHLWCLKHIIKNKYKGGAIIFEDDIVVHKNFESMFQQLFKEKQFDFLSMGACDFDFFDINYKNVTNGLYQPCLNNSKRCYGAHANYYSLNGAKYIFKLKSLFFSFFDNNFSNIFKHFNRTAFITYPNLFVTELSTSNINHNYHFYSLNEDYFYSNCFIDFKFKEYCFLYLSIIQKLADHCERNKTTLEINNKNIHQLLYNTLDDIPIEEEKKVSLIKRIDLEFFICKDIQTIMDVGGGTDE